MNEKGKNTIAVILIIIFLGVIGYCGYLVVDKLNSKATNNKQTNTEEKKDDNVVTVETKQIAEDLMEIVHGGRQGDIEQIYKKLANDNYIDYDKLPIEYKYIVVLTIPKVEATRFGTDFYATGYDIKTYDEEFHKLYGYDKEIEVKKCKNEQGLECFLPFYHDDNNYYDTGIDFGGHGGFIGVEYKIIDIKKQNDTMQIYIKTMPLKISFYDKTIIIYKSVENDEILEQFTTNLNDSVDYDKYIDKYSDQLNTYKWTFKYDKEHGNYYFYSLEKVK